MIKLGFTQRVEVVASYGERRDCLDQRWADWALAMNAIPLPLPNIDPAAIPQFMRAVQLDALVLSGGNSLSVLDPLALDSAPERDACEEALLRYAIDNDIAVFGVCRGMQMIQTFFGGVLEPIEGHVAQAHELIVHPDYEGLVAAQVNSFHNYGILHEELAPGLLPIAHDDAGHVEAAIHEKHRITGIMWHPEREKVFRHEDIALFKETLKK